jgi:hypothetical protein
MSKRKWVMGFGAALVALTLAGTAAAQGQEHGGYGPRGANFGHGADHFDAHYNHNHYYPARGGVVGVVPGHPVVYGGGRYYYSGGVWYAPRGPSFVVVAAPVGLFVPVLPPYYTTVWIAGAPYYYANDTYYTWDAGQNGYEVVAPPGDDQGASTQEPMAPPPQGDQLYVYPQNGQSPEQQANDKYECHKWASSQTGFDPTQPNSMPPDQLASTRADYHRAMVACLEGRGYSAR